MSVVLSLLASCSDPKHGAPRDGSSDGRDGQAGSGGQGGGSAGTGGGAGGGGGDAGGSGGGAGKCGGGATFGGGASPWKNPEIKCHWEAFERTVIATPLVIDLDGDGAPEIVFPSMWCMDGTRLCDTTKGKIHVIHGSDCVEAWSVDYKPGYWWDLALGDVTGDGEPEIVAFSNSAPADRIVQIYGAGGSLLASSPPVAGELGNAIAIADLDGVPPAEVIAGATVLRFESSPSPHVRVIWTKAGVEGGSIGMLSLVADVDLDGMPEVVTGNNIFAAATGLPKTPAALAALPGAYPAVAQFDLATPEPEIVLVSAASTGVVQIVNPKTGAVVFGPYSTGGGGGAPTVADFDGDGQPEVGVAGSGEYRVFDTECGAMPPPSKCKEPGVLWSSVTRDETSGVTGSTVFDFNRDCTAEVVYRDECWLRIYSGKTGEVLAAYAINSGTLLEEPVVADVDGDGHAEIVVSSDGPQPKGFCPEAPEEHIGAPWTGYTRGGVFVLKDPLDRWAPARKIWNQHTYHVTNVNPDGSIPSKESNSWDGENNYRQNVK